MSAKISVNLGDENYPLLIDHALQFFSGCTDALQEMGLHKFCQMVDLIEVIRIYPNQGLGTNGGIVVDVVVSNDKRKTNKSFVVLPKGNKTIRTFVKKEVVSITYKLARNLLRNSKEQVHVFEDRLGSDS